MDLIKYKLPSMFLRNKKLSVSMILVSALGMLLMIALTGFHTSMCSSVDSYYQNTCIMPDVVYVLDKPVLQDTLPELDAAVGQNGLFLMPMRGQSSSGRKLYFTAVVEDENTLWQDVTSEEKRSDRLVNVSISSELARRNNIKAGDSLYLNINGTQTEVCVGRIVVYISMFQIKREPGAIYDTTEYGTISISRQDFRYLYPEAGPELVNCIQQNFIDDSSISEMAMQYQKLLEEKHINVSSVIECGKINYLRDILDSIDSISLYVPLMFFLIMLLMLIIFLGVIVRNDRSQIGILRAIGYSVRQIGRLYRVYTLVVTCIASAVSLVFAYIILVIVMNLFCEQYGLSPCYLFEWTKCLEAMAFTVLFGQLAAYFSVSAAGRVRPSEALSGRSGEHKVLPLPVKKVLSRFGDLRKLIFGAALQNKVRLVTTMITIFMTGLLIIASLTIMVSRDYIYKNFEERFNFDTRAVFSVDVTEGIIEKVRNIKGVRHCEPYIINYPEFSFGTETFTAFLIGIEDNSELVKAAGTDGTLLHVPNEGIIMSEADADYLGCTIGDTISVNGTDTVITDLSVESDTHTLLCSFNEYSRIMGTGIKNSVIISAELESPEDENQLAERLSQIEGYEYSVYTRVQQQEMVYSYGPYSYAIVVILLLGIVLGFVIVYNISVINVNDRKAEYGLLRAIGVHVGTISFTSYAEILIQYIITMTAGILVSIPLMKLILQLLTIDRMKLYFRNNFWLYLIASLIVLLYITIGHFAAMRTVRKIDLVENVKMRD